MAKHYKPEQQRYMQNDESFPPSYPPPAYPPPGLPPRRPFIEPPTEPMRVRPAPDPPTVAVPAIHPPPPPAPSRVRLEPPVPIVSDEPPLLRRTGVLVGLAAGVATLLGVGVGIAGYAFTHSDSSSAIQPTPLAAIPTTSLPPDPVTAASVTEAVPPPPPATAPTTTTTTTTATTTSAAASSTTYAPSSGRFSGTISAKNGNTWTVTGWDGTRTTVRITSATKLIPQGSLLGGGSGFNPGQTVNIFWHTVGNTLVADSVYGSS